MALFLSEDSHLQDHLFNNIPIVFMLSYHVPPMVRSFSARVQLLKKYKYERSVSTLTRVTMLAMYVSLSSE